MEPRTRSKIQRKESSLPAATQRDPGDGKEGENTSRKRAASRAIETGDESVVQPKRLNARQKHQDPLPVRGRGVGRPKKASEGLKRNAGAPNHEEQDIYDVVTSDSEPRAKHSRQQNSAKRTTGTTTNARSQRLLQEVRQHNQRSSQRQRRTPERKKQGGSRTGSVTSGSDFVEESIPSGQREEPQGAAEAYEDNTQNAEPESGAEKDSTHTKEMDQYLQQLLRRFAITTAWNGLYKQCKEHKEQLHDSGKLDEFGKLRYKTKPFHRLDSFSSDLSTSYKNNELPNRHSPAFKYWKKSIESVRQALGSERHVQLVEDFYGPGIYRLTGTFGDALVANAEEAGGVNGEEPLRDLWALLEPILVLCEDTPRMGRASSSVEETSEDGVSEESSSQSKKRGKRNATPFFRHLQVIGRVILNAVSNIDRRVAASRAQDRFNEVQEEQRLAWEESRQIEQDRIKQRIAAQRQKMRERTLDTHGLIAPPIVSDVPQSTRMGTFPRRTPERKQDRGEGPHFSNEQDLRLLELLSSKAHLPLPERYTCCLADELLQNFLPEHIQKRSLEFKDSMIQVYEERGEPAPLWVASIEVAINPQSVVHV